jgi:hypothetical protein
MTSLRLLSLGDNEDGYRVNEILRLPAGGGAMVMELGTMKKQCIQSKS